MWFILINRVWKLYLKQKRQFSLFCDSLPVWKKSYFWDRKLPGGVFWRHLQKESTWYLLRRDRGEVTPSWQTDRQTVSFYNIRCCMSCVDQTANSETFISLVVVAKDQTNRCCPTDVQGSFLSVVVYDCSVWSSFRCRSCRGVWCWCIYMWLGYWCLFYVYFIDGISLIRGSSSFSVELLATKDYNNLISANLRWFLWQLL